MSDTAEAVDFDLSLDVHCNITAKITLNCVEVFDLITKLCDFCFGEVLRTSVGIDACLCKNVICTLAAYTVNVGKSDFNAFRVWNINTSYTSPFISPL